MSEFWESSDVWLPGVLAMSGLILGSGFFSSAETAFFYLSPDELREMKTGPPRQRLIVHLLSDPDRLLTAILFWNLVINLMFFAISLMTARRLIAIDQTTAAGLLGAGSLGFIIVFGEVVPKSLAVVIRKPLATWFAWPMSLAVRVLDPVMPALISLTRGIRRAVWPDLKYERYLNAADLERALKTIPQGHGIDESEREVLHRILDLSELTAEEAMRPRGTYPVFPFPISMENTHGLLNGMEYLLVQEDDVGSLGGAIPLGTISDPSQVEADSAVLPVIHIPWCATLADTLSEMVAQHTRVAAIVNEHGETIGIVTEEDILDTVLAPQPSRTRRILRREPVLEVSEKTYHVEGMTTLRYLAGRLGVEFDPDDGESVTVQGLLLERLERFPQAGDQCEWHQWHFRVFDTDGPRRVRVLVSREPKDGESPEMTPGPPGLEKT